jgi:PP-loop superfamily ATP-utilizing enzyme
MKKIIAWFSGGITSAVACKLAIDKYGPENCRVIFIDTRNEHEDTYRFLKDCQKWYGLEIETIASDSYSSIEETWFRHLSLNTAKGAICSYKLKRVVREKWQKTNEYSNQVFGFEDSLREIGRARALELNHPKTRPVFPLIEHGLTKSDCLKIVSGAGITLPVAYSMGFHNNNCLKTGCVQGGIGYWKKIQKELPEVFEKMAKVEHDLTRLKGSPVTMLKTEKHGLIFLKENPDYPEMKSIEAVKGRKVNPLIDCNGFCGVNELSEINQTQFEINWEQIGEL